MISEKEMENAIVLDPTKYIGEDGLRLIARQYSIGSYRFDLLFEDRHGGKLIVELQCGILDRIHMFKILDYCDEFRDHHPSEFVEPMVIANIIPPERKRRMSHDGIPFREIPETEFIGAILPKDSNSIQELITRQEQSSFSKDIVEPLITNSADELAASIPQQLPGFSKTEMDDLNNSIHTFNKVVLPRKIKRESEAQQLLHQSVGKYTSEIIDKVFDLVDIDPSGLWFGSTLIKPNRTRLYNCQMDELNRLIEKLFETGDLGWLGEWRLKGNRGMKTGIASILMYIYNPEHNNVWLPTLHKGLSKLVNLDTNFPSYELSSEEYSVSYKKFNETAITVRKANGFVPQGVDWFLWAVNEIKENPGNRYLQAYIDGSRE